MSNKITTTVEAGFAFGYKALELTQDEAMSRIEGYGPSWIFVIMRDDNTIRSNGRFRRVTSEHLSQADWNSVGKVIICPPLSARPRRGNEW